MKRVPLLMVAEPISPGVDPFDGKRGYVATGDLDDDGVYSMVAVTFDDRPSRANQIANVGDVLFARMAETKKVLQVGKNEADLIYSTGFCVLRPKRHQISSRYLYHFVRTPYFQNEKNMRATGATQRAITNEKLAEITIPMPRDLAEQERLAAILDKADVIHRNRQQAIKLADELLRSVFLDMFGDPAVNPKGLNTASIKKLGNVVTGNTPSRAHPEFYGDTIEWIKSDNINSPYHFLTNAIEGLSAQGKEVGRTVPPNSILVTCIAGSRDCIGNAAIADREVAFNQQINAITPYEGIDPFFLYTQILIAKPLIQRASTNGMKGLVSKSKFEKVRLLAPPEKEQREFGRFFKKHIQYVERLDGSHHHAEVLFKSAIQRAFRGEL